MTEVHHEPRSPMATGILVALAVAAAGAGVLGFLWLVVTLGVGLAG